MPAGRSRSSPRRRAFFILFLLRLGRLDRDGRDFASMCPLAAAVLRLAGVHFECRFTAGMIVSTVAWRNLPHITKETFKGKERGGMNFDENNKKDN